MRKWLIALAALAAPLFFGSAEESQACSSSSCTPTYYKCEVGGQVVQSGWAPRAQIDIICKGSQNQAMKYVEETKPRSDKKALPAFRQTKTEAKTTTVAQDFGSGWKSVHPAGNCGVGRDAPSFTIYEDIAATCDVQPGTGGYNMKQIGRAKPIYADGCVLRIGTSHTTFTKACKRIVTGIKVTSEGLLVKATFMKRTNVYLLRQFAGNWGAKRVQ